MPQVLSRTPQGVTVQQDDGSVVFLPPDVADQLTGPPAPDSQVGAPVSDPAAESPVPPGPYPGPPPVDAAPPQAQAPVAAPVPGPPGAGEGPRSVSPTPPGAAALPPDEQQLDPSAPALVRQAQAQAAGGAAAFDAAMVQDDLSRQAEAAAAPLDAQRQEERAKEQAVQEATHAQVAAAIKAQADYDVRAPRETAGDTIGKMIALALSGVGQALSRQSGPNPVVAILERKAEAEAQERMRRYGQLGDAVAQKKGEFDEVGTTIKSNEARFEAHKASILAKYYKEGERQTVIAGGTKEMWAATATAQETLGKHEESIAKAQEQEYQHTKDAAAQKLAQGNLRVAQSNAAVSAGQLSLAREKEKADIGDKAFARSVTLAKLPGELAAQGAKKPEERRLEVDIQKNLDARGSPKIPTTVRDTKGNPKGVKWADLVNDDGKPYVYPSPEIGQTLGPTIAATQKYVKASDELERLRGDAGAELFKTGDARRMLVEFSNLQVSLKDQFKLGVLSDSDLKLLNNAIGTNDPTEIRAFIGALHQARGRAISNLDTDMRTIGRYTGKPLEFANMNTADRGTEDADVKTAIAESRSNPSPLTPEGRAWLGLPAGDDLTPKGRASVDAVAAQAGAGDLDARRKLAALVKDPGTTHYARAAAAQLGIDLGEFGVR